jgi:hypothetical protein
MHRISQAYNALHKLSRFGKRMEERAVERNLKHIEESAEGASMTTNQKAAAAQLHGEQCKFRYISKPELWSILIKAEIDPMDARKFIAERLVVAVVAVVATAGGDDEDIEAADGTSGDGDHVHTHAKERRLSTWHKQSVHDSVHDLQALDKVRHFREEGKAEGKEEGAGGSSGDGGGTLEAKKRVARRKRKKGRSRGGETESLVFQSNTALLAAESPAVFDEVNDLLGAVESSSRSTPSGSSSKVMPLYRDVRDDGIGEDQGGIGEGQGISQRTSGVHLEGRLGDAKGRLGDAKGRVASADGSIADGVVADGADGAGAGAGGKIIADEAGADVSGSMFGWNSTTSGADALASDGAAASSFSAGSGAGSWFGLANGNTESQAQDRFIERMRLVVREEVKAAVKSNTTAASNAPVDPTSSERNAAAAAAAAEDISERSMLDEQNTVFIDTASGEPGVHATKVSAEISQCLMAVRALTSRLEKLERMQKQPRS